MRAFQDCRGLSRLRREADLPKFVSTRLVTELDAGIPDYFGPLGSFFLDDRCKLGRRVADGLEAEFVEPLAYLR